MATFNTGSLQFGQSFFNAPSGFYCIHRTPNTWRVAADGVRYGLTTFMNPAMAGNGSSTTSAVYVANSSGGGAVTSSSFSVPAAGSAVYQGNKAVTKLLTGNTNYRFGYTQPGSLLVGRGGTGRIYRLDTGAGTSWANQLAITVTVAEVPGAPTGVTLTPGGGTIDVDWTAPARDGGSAVTGYVIRWADNPLMNNAETFPAPGTGTSATIPATGLTYVQVGAVNAVATAANTSGPFSETVSAIATETPQGSFNVLTFDDNGVLYAGFRGEPYVVQYDLDQGAPTARWYPVTSSGRDVTVTEQLANYGADAEGVARVIGGFTGTPRLDRGAIQVYPVPYSTLESAIREYVSLIGEDIPVAYSASENPEVSIPAWRGDVWAMLNQLCASHSVELAIDNDTIVVRDCAIRELAVDDKINTSHGVSLQSASRYITVAWTNAESGSGVLFDAADSGRVYSVNAGESISDTLSTDNSPAYIPPLVRTAVIPIGPNSYMVTDSNGVVVPLRLFEEAGGDVSAVADPEIPGAIDFTVTGPTFDIPEYPGPYRLAYPTTDGSAGDSPALIISGSGVFTSPGEEPIYTGASPDSTKREEGVRVDHPFLQNRDHAYKRGVWAAAKASGSWPTLSFSLSAKDCEGFGLTSGSLFRYKDCIYRVTDSTITRSGVSLSAEFHTTAQDFEDRWEGQTAQDVADHWVEYTAKDIPLKPLR